MTDTTLDELIERTEAQIEANEQFLLILDTMKADRNYKRLSFESKTGISL